jgi:APA family basic amino acid/polyamine antiporter
MPGETNAAIQPKLGVFDLTMIVVSLVIGVGIFRTPALVAESARTTPLFFAAWIVGGLVSLCGALTYAEIGSRYPVPGGFYKVVSECYHPAFALMLNWVYVLVQGAGAAGVSIIGAEYINPILFPAAWQGPALVKATVIGVVAVLFVLNYLGIRVGAWAQNVLTVVKMVMLTALCLAAFGGPGPAAAAPVGEAASGSWWTAFGVGLISVFYTYGGYQGTMNFGGDVVNPRRTVPLGILTGIGLIIGLYLLVNVAYVRTLGVEGVRGAKLVAAGVAQAFFGPSGLVLVSVAIFISVLGFVNVTLMQNPRMYYAMAEDRILPPAFRRVNPRTQVQEFALVFFTAVVVLSVFFLGTFEKIVNYVMFIDSFSLATVASTLFVLRRRAGKDQTYVGFKVPLYPVVPLVFIGFLLSVTLNVLVTDTASALVGFGFFVAGLPLYGFMRRLYPKK